MPPTSGRGRRAGIAIHRAALDRDQRTIHDGSRSRRPLEHCSTWAHDSTCVKSSVPSTRPSPTRGRRPTLCGRSVSVRGLAAVSAGAPHDHRRRRALRPPDPLAARGVLPRTRPRGWTSAAGAQRAHREACGSTPSGAHERVAVELDGYRWHRTRYAGSRLIATVRRRCAGEDGSPLRYSARQVFDQPLVAGRATWRPSWLGSARRLDLAFRGGVVGSTPGFGPGSRGSIPRPGVGGSRSGSPRGLGVRLHRRVGRGRAAARRSSRRSRMRRPIPSGGSRSTSRSRPTGRRRSGGSRSRSSRASSPIT